MPEKSIATALGRLTERLDRILSLGERFLAAEQPAPTLSVPFATHWAFRWRHESGGGRLHPVAHPDIPPLGHLLGIDRALGELRRNTRQFLAGMPANNVLLWGERGNGKSSAIKGLLGEFGNAGLRLIEIQKGDLFDLPEITGGLREEPYHFILFCDDLSFDESEASYRDLKALLEGGIEAPPRNVLVYATSNRRHLMPERFRENLPDQEIHPEETVAEKLSLSDRFGLQLGFYVMHQDLYLTVVRHYVRLQNLPVEPAWLERDALRWALARGHRSGRVARQFVDDLAGRLAFEDGLGGAGRNKGLASSTISV